MAERFCDGALVLDFLEEGSIARWLERLEALDEAQEGIHTQHEYRIAAWKQRYSRWKESISRRTYEEKALAGKTEVQGHYGGCLYGIRRTEV